MATPALALYKVDFLTASIGGGILKFGSFTLKSGRQSPYFFNAGDFYRADLLRAISTAYAKAIIADQTSSQPSLDFDIVFGPAYKGIPLASSTEGEEGPWGGGGIVGAPLNGKRVLIVDDVVTAGTAKREAIGKIRDEGGIVAGIVVALDRMEKLPSPDGDDSKAMPSAIGEIRKEYGIPVLAILTLDDIIAGLKGKISDEEIKSMEEYRQKYKATD
ncbi:Orotate phosphoribosyltransferase [Hyphodiscus hymeniophilus]|uniref:orotate phosphoribosyltransferase n=1 Tax=Hyphodiscus hymeniophilus TaxID=353542 RepID=A0A9P7AXB3_9HELO|nr:Orotate phosphoribosyltransferase [Hyphodiscus hymeniophilus]